MTDKVEQIRKKIKERAEYFCSVCKHSEANALRGLLPIIDSLQGTTAPLTKENSTALSGAGSVVGPLQEDPKPKFKIGDTVIHVDDGADILYKEHKVVNVLELGYILDNGHSIEMEDQDDWELVKEPESEELENIAENYAYNKAPSVGATNTEIVEAFKAGMEKMREQMMKDAVDAFVYRGGIRLKEWPLSGARIEKTYPIKLIIIKQEEE